MASTRFIDLVRALVELAELYLQLAWLYLQLFALRVDIYAIRAGVWITANPDQTIAAALGLTGAFLLATKGRWASVGWVAFLGSNVGWIWYAWRADAPALLVQQVGFTVTSLTGLWMWLVKPSLAWDEWRGDDAGNVTMQIKHLVSWRGRRVDLHRFVAADRVGRFHTHPAQAIRVVLWGGYQEEIETGVPNVQIFNSLRPGTIGRVNPELSHRINALPRGTSYSLWLRGRKTHEIELRGPGWRQQA